MEERAIAAETDEGGGELVRELSSGHDLDARLSGRAGGGCTCGSRECLRRGGVETIQDRVSYFLPLWDFVRRRMSAYSLIPRYRLLQHRERFVVADYCSSARSVGQERNEHRTMYMIGGDVR